MKYVIFLLVMFSLQGFAQNQDYYISITGDTIHGTIQVRNNNFNQFTFIGSDSEKKIISSDAVSFYLTKPGTSYQLIKTKLGDYFFKTEVKGEVTLFSTKKENEKFFLLRRETKDDVLFAESYGKSSRTKQVQSKSSQLEFINTIGSLKNFFSDCGGITESQVIKTYSNERELREARLYSIITICNKAKDTLFKEDESKKIVYTIGTLTSVGISKIKVIKGYYFEKSGLSGSSTINLAPGIRVTAGFRRKTLFFIEGSYGAGSFSSSKTYIYSNYSEKFESNVKFKQADFSLGLQRNFKIVENFYISPIASLNMGLYRVNKINVKYNAEYGGSGFERNQYPNGYKDDPYIRINVGLQISKKIVKKTFLYGEYTLPHSTELKFLTAKGIDAPTKFNIKTNSIKIGFFWNL
jgi:hypothetical protein